MQNDLEQLKARFEKYLENSYPEVGGFHPHYGDSLLVMLKGGGKRFRPMLLLSVVHAENPLLVESALPIALGIEYLHTYSLIHDDLPAMDDARLRRGIPTLHTTYDEVTAILAGDALNTHAFYLISSAPLSASVRIECVRELSDNGGVHGMVLGQALDCHFENQTLALDQLQFLHIHKTGKLIAASLKMGAIIAGWNAKSQEGIYRFGIDLGLMFQIHDDIIDVTHSAEEAGKSTQNDDNKNSYVNLMGLQEAVAARDAIKASLQKRLADYPESLRNNFSGLLAKYFN